MKRLFAAGFPEDVDDDAEGVIQKHRRLAERASAV
jgi:hypothetical protein